MLYLLVFTQSERKTADALLLDVLLVFTQSERKTADALLLDVLWKEQER